MLFSGAMAGEDKTHCACVCVPSIQLWLASAVADALLLLLGSQLVGTGNCRDTVEWVKKRMFWFGPKVSAVGQQAIRDGRIRRKRKKWGRQDRIEWWKSKKEEKRGRKPRKSQSKRMAEERLVLLLLLEKPLLPFFPFLAPSWISIRNRLEWRAPMVVIAAAIVARRRWCPLFQMPPVCP